MLKKAKLKNTKIIPIDSEHNAIFQVFEESNFNEIEKIINVEASTYEEQIYAFEEQVKIAIDTNKPLFLHQRDSHDDFIKILGKYSYDINKSVVHCFTGTQSQLEDYLELGCYIGITGWICDEKRNTELRKAVKNIPLSKLMIETDCPYLIPKDLPNKPKNNRNEPINLNHIVSEIARLMEIDEDTLRKETYINSLNFFES